MTTPGEDPRERELAYYRRQVDTVAGENLRLEYVISGLRHELKQKRQGFALLSQLQGSIGAHQQISSIFAVALPAIGATLGMDRAVVLSPGQSEHRYRPTRWIGFRQEAVAAFPSLELELPPAVASGAERLIVTKATPVTPLVERLRAAFELPYFVCVPVVVDERPIALLLSGRLRESKPIYPPLDEGDLDTFVAIAGLISASVRNMRIGVLEEMDRLRTEFFANVSHEFRTPITLTLGPLEQLAAGRYGELPPPAREQLAVMRRSQHRLLVLVNQILDLAKFEAGGMRLRAARVPDAGRIVGDVAAQFASAAAERGLAWRVDVAPEVAGADVWLDREQFERALGNLLANALKFTRRGHVEITADVRDGAFRVSVADTGVGIKDDQLPYIFDRFRQADGSESREFAGTGIGLALVREIARLHGGDVQATSRYGEGTTFRLTVPLGRAHLEPDAAAGADAAVVPDAGGSADVLGGGDFLVAQEGGADREGTEEHNRRAEAAFDASRPTVVYAEDNSDLRRHVRDLLGDAYNVFLAADGREALEHARRYRPDLVLSDQMMPGMSGAELLRALREDEALRRVPVLFLTARAGTAARVESLEAGADDYLTKPFDAGELLARVRNLLRAREQERQLAVLNDRLAARVERQVADLLRSGELQRFLPRPLVDRVLAGDLHADRPLERRRITVLAAELLGVAELTEALEPEELAATLDDVLRELGAVVVEHGGTLDRLGTSGCVALFGALEALEPEAHAWAAAEAALALRDRLRVLAVTWRRRGVAAALETRIGLNTGFCTVGVFGSDVQRSFTAVGLPVTVAALLPAHAAPGAVLCTRATHTLIAARVSARAGAEVTLPGVARAVTCVELLGPAAAPPLPRLPGPTFVPL